MREEGRTLFSRNDTFTKPNLKTCKQIPCRQGKDGQKVAGTAFALGLTSLRECLCAVFFVGFPPDE